MVAFSIATPPHVLVIDAPEQGTPFVPVVRRYSKSAYLSLIGGQRGFNNAMRAGSIVAVDHARYDREADEIQVTDRDCIGRQYLVLHPAVPLGLIITARGSEHVELDMRRLFNDRDEAEQAAADVVRMLRRMGAAIEGDAHSVSHYG